MQPTYAVNGNQTGKSEQVVQGAVIAEPIPHEFNQDASHATPSATAIPVESIGECRRCGREFVRNPKDHREGTAQYYRCKDCGNFRLSDIPPFDQCAIS